MKAFDTPVSSIMTKEVVAAAYHNTFSQIEEFFTQFKVNHIPVMHGIELVGILSSTDIIRFYAKNAAKLSNGEIKSFDEIFVIKDEMVKNPTFLRPTDTIRKALDILGEGKFQCLPVLEENQLVGIITNKDLVRFFSVVE